MIGLELFLIFKFLHSIEEFESVYEEFLELFSISILQVYSFYSIESDLSSLISYGYTSY